MRMLMKVTIPVEMGNKAIREGILQRVMQEAFAMIRPEATYFYTENGKRCCHVFCEMKDNAQMVQFGEPFFMGLNADVQFFPVMNQDDLMRGMEMWGKKAH